MLNWIKVEGIMKKKIIAMFMAIGIGSIALTGCGEDKIEKEESVETTTVNPVQEEKEKYTDDKQALGSMQDALKDYIDEVSTNELSDDAKEVYNNHLKDSLEGKVSDENLQDMLDIMNGSKEETSDLN
jgi:hypothetical protein